MFCIKLSRGGEYLEKLYWNVSPSCRSLAIRTSDCAHVSCLLPHSAPSPFVLLLVLRGPKMLGFSAAGVCMWWVGPVATPLYVFENGNGVPANKDCCLWIALVSFHWFHIICAVFDALIQMFLLPVSVYSNLFCRIVYSMFLLICIWNPLQMSYTFLPALHKFSLQLKTFKSVVPWWTHYPACLQFFFLKNK